MRIGLALAYPAVIASIGATRAGVTRAGATQAAPTLEALAAAWSAGRAEPQCQPRGPRGEYLGPAPGAAYCQWPTVARNLGVGMVSGHRDAVTGLGEITWDRMLPDTAAVTRLADSLGGALTARGLHGRVCPGGGRRWEAAALGVQFLRVRSRPDVGPRVLVFATTVPSALPDLNCPRARSGGAPGA